MHGDKSWLAHNKIGWGNTLIDFLVWGYKFLGTQRSTLTKRFFSIMFIHIAEEYDDLSPRAHRIMEAAKAIKLRGKTCKKAPPNTDLLRWLNSALEVAADWMRLVSAIQLWAGLLIALFFCPRI